LQYTDAQQVTFRAEHEKRRRAQNIVATVGFGLILALKVTNDDEANTGLGHSPGVVVPVVFVVFAGLAILSSETPILLFPPTSSSLGGCPWEGNADCWRPRLPPVCNS
jgi:hypothetical protein